MNRRYLLCLLALIFVLGSFGCQSEPEATKPETTATVPTETTLPPPDPAAVYGEAREQLEGRETVTLDVTQTVTTLVGGQSLEEEVTYALSYAAGNTDDPTVQLEKTVTIPSINSLMESEGEELEKEGKYTEWYADGTVYIELEDIGGFRGTVDTMEGRYAPVALLDESLYGAMELTEGETTVITFAEPTGAESWAMPQDATLVEASGEAHMDAQGVLTQMQYTLTYEYGSAVVTVKTQTVPREEALEVTLPEKAEKFTELSCVDAIATVLQARELSDEIDSAEAVDGQTIVIQAAGMMYVQDTTTHIYRDEENGLLMKAKDKVAYRDTEESEVTETETNYRDGKVVSTVDDGVPTSQSGLKDEYVWDEYCSALLSVDDELTMFQWWQNAEMEDLGSLYYFTVTPTEDWSNTVQNGVCAVFFNDPGFLNQYATAYETKKHEVYFSVDKYTGLIVSFGYTFEGEHTIDGDPYLLSVALDRSVSAPFAGAYTEITDEVLPGQAPENPATPLFYHVTGQDGQEMWLLGTIHVGDERTGYLPQAIYDALAASDALALEIDNDSLSARIEEDSKLQQAIMDAYYYSDGTQTKDYLEEDLYEKALKYLKATGNYNPNVEYMKPSMWETLLSTFYLEQGHQLSSGQGVEEQLTRLAKEQEKPIREVEDPVAHIRVTTDWSKELQARILKEILETDPKESWAETVELYEMWCQGDEAALREYINDEGLEDMTEEERADYEANKHLFDEYDKSMSFDRNEDMLEVAVEYLESDDVVFYAVGLAHLLDGTNGLVDALREAGYTVELVK